MLKDTLVSSRVEHNYDSTDSNIPAGIFLEAEQQQHEENLKNISEHFTLLKKQYPSFLPTIEMKAEQKALEGKTDEAVKYFRELLQRKPTQTYYALRAGQVLEDASRMKEAREYLVHASRTLGVGRRSRLASIFACSLAYRNEADQLKHLTGHSRLSAIKALAAHLSQRATEAVEYYYLTAFYALAQKSAELFHLAASECGNENEREELMQKANVEYASVDDIYGLNTIHGTPSKDVYGPIEIPFTGSPV